MDSDKYERGREVFWTMLGKQADAATVFYERARPEFRIDGDVLRDVGSLGV